jgi:hypothetical protein
MSQQKKSSAWKWIGIGCGAGCLVLLIVGGIAGYGLFKVGKGFVPKPTTYEQAQQTARFLVMKPTYLPAGAGEPQMMMMDPQQGMMSVAQSFMLVYSGGGQQIIITQMRGDVPGMTSGAAETVNGRPVYVQQQQGRQTVVARYDTTLVMAMGGSLDEMKKIAASMQPVYPDKLETVRQAQKSMPIPGNAQMPTQFPGMPGGK